MTTAIGLFLDVLTTGSLKESEVRVVARLVRCHEATNGPWSGGIAALAQDIDMARAQCYRAVRSLSERGLVVVSQQGASTCLSLAADPDVWGRAGAPIATAITAREPGLDGDSGGTPVPPEECDSAVTQAEFNAACLSGVTPASDPAVSAAAADATVPEITPAHIAALFTVPDRRRCSDLRRIGDVMGEIWKEAGLK
jgi:hypothetical protein